MNALTKYEGSALSLSFDDITRMAESMSKAQLFGKQTPQQLLSLMLIAQANGQHPAAAARDYDVIQGRPSKKAEAMLRDFLLAGGKVEWHTYSDQKCDATFSHPQGGSIRIDWDHARVAQAKISNPDMYKKYPRNMLRARCISEGVRTVCPVATGGLYAPEEAHDMGPPPKHMGSADVVVDPVDVAEWISKAQATTTDAQAALVWKDGALALANAHDKDGYARFKAAVIARRQALKDMGRTVDAQASEVDDPFVAQMNAAEGAQS